MNKFCAETGVGLIPWGLLAGGLLAKKVGEESKRSAATLAQSETCCPRRSGSRSSFSTGAIALVAHL